MSRFPRRVTRASAIVLLAVSLFACADDNPGHFGDGDEPPGSDTATLETPTEPSASTESPAAPEPSVPPLHPSVDGYPEALVRLQGGDTLVEIPVKVADTADNRAHGLMEVEDLPAGTGMLFVFDDERTGGFWMKDTLVPLDIAYADAAGAIVAIMAMDPCTADPCEVYDPEAPYQRALEVPQGWFAEVGVEVGDTLDFEPLDSDG